MGAVKIMLFVTMCSADTLHCLEIPTSRLEFTTPDECQARLDRMVEALGDADHAYPRAMGRCRYAISGPEAQVVPESM